MEPFVSLQLFKDLMLDENLEVGYKMFISLSTNPNVDQELVTYLADWLWDNGVVMTI